MATSIFVGKTPSISTNSVYYMRYDKQICACKVLEFKTYYPPTARGFKKTILKVKIALHGIKEIELTKYDKVIPLYATINDCMENKPIGRYFEVPMYSMSAELFHSMGVGYKKTHYYGSGYALTQGYYMWNGYEPVFKIFDYEKVPNSFFYDHLLNDVFVNEEVYGFGKYVTKEECIADNTIKVVEFEDEEPIKEQEFEITIKITATSRDKAMEKVQALL